MRHQPDHPRPQALIVQALRGPKPVVERRSMNEEQKTAATAATRAFFETVSKADQVHEAAIADAGTVYRKAIDNVLGTLAVDEGWKVDPIRGDLLRVLPGDTPALDEEAGDG